MPRAERWNCSSVLQANELSGNSSITDRTSPYTSEWRNRPEIARLSLTKPDIEPRTRINQHSVGARASTISPRMPPHRPRNSRRMGLAIRSRIQNTPFTKQKMIPVLANHRRTGQASEIFNGWVGEGAIRVREIHGRCTTEVISCHLGMDLSGIPQFKEGKREAMARKLLEDLRPILLYFSMVQLATLCMSLPDALIDPYLLLVIHGYDGLCGKTSSTTDTVPATE